MDKTQLRQQLRCHRRSLTPAQQQSFAQQATQRLIKLLLKPHITRVALYLSNDGELDTTPIIEALWSYGTEVYLPRLHPFSKGNLIFLNYHHRSLLTKNHLGIVEPRLDITQMALIDEIDIVITPLVAFDSKGNRMGMGGGYYDRTLANWQNLDRPLPIGYAHDCQQVESIPIEHWDISLPVIITPSQMLVDNSTSSTRLKTLFA